MKSILICLAVFMVTLMMVEGDDKPITPIPRNCPKKDSLDYTVHIAHEKDCTRFYKCQAGKKIPKDGLQCPKMIDGHRLYFNPSLQVCDWPSKVDCRLPIVDDDEPDSEERNNEQFDDDDNNNLYEDDLPEDSVLSRLLMN
ncbi:uncharacterized protein LOC127283235 [Leptopilina boulardi]|uniref:uncharacterized protein LOC127283235 n=1 Tax=Leptopilina boulardi TaxID=63433 RepID=UPI0021F50440|nr:uncharacterized protein LOC127283235 [Leptopilina boulardi]